MLFKETHLKGAFVIESERREDARGYFARTFCRREFEARGLPAGFVQCNVSYNKRKGTLRGMHFQAAPYEEAKLIRCTRGAIHDVIIDLRRGSPTFKQHFAARLTATNGTMLFIPEGFAHGFQTLEHDTDVFYLMSQYYEPAHARGVRWNDLAFGIEWPSDVRTMNDRDIAYPDYVTE